MAKKTEFQVTVGYKAVISMTVKCETEDEAREIATNKIKDIGIYDGDILDEWYQISGVVNIDTSWNMVQS